MINLERLDEAIGKIEANPGLHIQEHWFSRNDGGCGTAACLAGTLCLLDGWEPHGWSDWGTAGMAIKDGRIREVDVVAMDILGCERSFDDTKDTEETDDESVAWMLFDFANTIHDIKRIRNNIAAGKY